MISPVDALVFAYQRMVRVLFKPFHLEKWFVLGFCAFLAHCGEGGGFNFRQGGGHPSSRGRSPGLREMADETARTISEYMPYIIIGTIVLVPLLIAIGVVIAWLRARGKFMFLDGIVQNRGAVVEPWHRFASLANSLFVFNLIYSIIVSIVSSGTLIVVGVIAWGAIHASSMVSGLLLAGLIAAAVFIPLLVVSLVISLLLDDFVVPIMYLRNVKVMEAWRLVRREIVAGHLGDLVIFYLLKFAIGIGVVIAMILLACITCCIAGCLSLIPYIGTVVLLPLFVFRRCFSVYLLQQFGPQWLIMPVEPDPECSNYNLPPPIPLQ